MVITVFGATGMVGKQVVKQGLAMGYTIKAFGRNVQSLIDEDNRNDKLFAIKGFVFDKQDVADAIKGTDVVISVLGGSFDGTDKTRSSGMKNIVEQMQKQSIKRIVALGGMGILNGNDGELLIDSKDYPEEYKPVGREHLEAYQYLKNSTLLWTFVCSADILDKEASELYITNADFPTTPNNFQISAGDLAHFMLHECSKNEFVCQRVSISRL